jgi:cytoskeletal protein CcmA (bactofilin family)
VAIFSNAKPEGPPLDHPHRRRTDQIPLSIIAKDLTITGDLDSEGVVKIEGRVKGTVRAESQVLVSPGALIEGDLHTKEAIIAGEVRGSIMAAERTELQASAVVVGDIHTQRIAVLEGARVSGEVKMDGSSTVAADSHMS